MSDYGVLVMFNVFTRRISETVVLSGVDDKFAVFHRGKKDTTSPAFRNVEGKLLSDLPEMNDAPSLADRANIILYNRSVVARLVPFDTMDEAVEYAKNISAQAPSAEEFARSQELPQ